MNKLLYILKGMAIAIPLALTSGLLASILNALAIYFELYFPARIQRAWIRSDEFLDFLFYQLIFIAIYSIGFEFLRNRRKSRLIFTISCLVLYYTAIIYSGFFNYYVSMEIRSTVFLFPLIAVFIRELIFGKLLTYLWSSFKGVRLKMATR